MRVMSPEVGSISPVRHLSKVDLPRPLAATMPSRSPVPMVRSRLEKSGALMVTPRDLRLIRAILISLVLPGAGSMHLTVRVLAIRLGVATPRRADQKNRSGKNPDRPWSALQASSQGRNRATLTMVTIKREHVSPPFKTFECGERLHQRRAGWQGECEREQSAGAANLPPCGGDVRQDRGGREGSLPSRSPSLAWPALFTAKSVGSS